jgi:hypothetical protein
MIIESIKVKGVGKETASLEFLSGLNVVSGASDTGKSYVVKCLQFIFGGEDPPKPIKEAAGYTSLEVAFIIDDDNSFVLKRELERGTKIVLVEMFGGGSDEVTTTLSASHKGKNNLSKYFLEKLNLNEMFLVKGVESLKHSSLTLRILSKLFLIDEGRIITEGSILGEGRTEQTQERSLLKTLLTGSDDSEVMELMSQKTAETGLKTKISVLEDYLASAHVDSEDSQTNIDELDAELECLESSLSDARQELGSLIAANRDLDTRRTQLSNSITDYEVRLRENGALSDRFELLSSKYESDRERLVAGAEAVSNLGQYQAVACPTCGQDFEMDEDAAELSLLGSSTDAEIQKIDVRLSGLQSTLQDVSEEAIFLSLELESANSDYNEVSKLIESSIASKLNDYNLAINVLSAKKAEFTAERSRVESRNRLLQEIGSLQVRLDSDTGKYEIPDSTRELKGLCKEVSTILTRWAFPDSNVVTFDNKDRDIVIGNKPRSHFGKGYRAIGFSAFVLGLMEYLTKLERHPGFVILDSPLTTYRKGDDDEGDEQVRLEKDLIFAFYIDLCESFQDKQVIVFDNQEPDQDLISKMKYYHFSKNTEIGRYGFFPVAEQ